MEDALAACLDNLFQRTLVGKARYSPPSESTWCEPLPRVPVFVLPSWHMNHFFVHLCEVLTAGGLGNLRTLKLKVI